MGILGWLVVIALGVALFFGTGGLAGIIAVVFLMLVAKFKGGA